MPATQYIGFVPPVTPPKTKETGAKKRQSISCIAPHETGPGLCGKKTVARSLCSTHNRRLLRNGTLVRKRAPNGTWTPCKHPDGCPEPVYSKGWCHKHHERVSNYGAPGPAGRTEHAIVAKTCKHPDGCPRPVKVGGWCGLHAGRYYKSGDPGPLNRLVSRPTPQHELGCIHPDGCPNSRYAHGWCHMHYARIQTTGKPGPAGMRRVANGARDAIRRPKAGSAS